ncbi:hypothetical protein HanIR_Chr14g0710241 [Helianthus annuus]|nr:hypothetical protein HanIR_Chr14g0710241 [Helianthus annuus]
MQIRLSVQVVDALGSSPIFTLGSSPIFTFSLYFRFPSFYPYSTFKHKSITQSTLHNLAGNQKTCYLSCLVAA